MFCQRIQRSSLPMTYYCQRRKIDDGIRLNQQPPQADCCGEPANNFIIVYGEKQWLCPRHYDGSRRTAGRAAHRGRGTGRRRKSSVVVSAVPKAFAYPRNLVPVPHRSVTSEYASDRLSGRQGPTVPARSFRSCRSRAGRMSSRSAGEGTCSGRQCQSVSSTGRGG
jgi:hypothetical protein